MSEKNTLRVPSGAKAGSLFALYGTTEVVPFPNRFMRQVLRTRNSTALPLELPAC
jgi:hypothetical protein